MDDKRVIVRFTQHLIETAQEQIDMSLSAMHNIEGLGLEDLEDIDKSMAMLDVSSDRIRKHLASMLKLQRIKPQE